MNNMMQFIQLTHYYQKIDKLFWLNTENISHFQKNSFIIRDEKGNEKEAYYTSICLKMLYDGKYTSPLRVAETEEEIIRLIGTINWCYKN